jgi:hypothetical protein
VASLVISKVNELLQKSTISFFSSICKVEMPLWDPTSNFKSLYIGKHIIIPQTGVCTIEFMGFWLLHMLLMLIHFNMLAYLTIMVILSSYVPWYVMKIV